MLKCLAGLLLVAAVALAGESSFKAEYLGGSVAGVPRGNGKILTSDSDLFIFELPGSTRRIPYQKINLIEYGQEVSRRLLLAYTLSPMFLLSKSRKHFVTVGYRDEKDEQQAMVLRVDKSSVRSVLAVLEARSGRIVQYQDEEARKFRRR